MKLFAILTVAGLATALPSPPDGILIAARGQSGGRGAVQAEAGSNTTTTACSSATRRKAQKLAMGIRANLQIQKAELEGIQGMQPQQQGASASSSMTASDFATKRAAVLRVQERGVNIREMNQKIAQSINSPALAGLNTVQQAQLLEISQVKNLTGNAAVDGAILTQLAKEVKDGTQQNQKNLAAALSQCPDAASAPTPATGAKAGSGVGCDAPKSSG